MNSVIIFNRRREFMQDGINKLFRLVAPALLSAAFLTACGGSDTAVAPSTLSGTAAVGLPIVGGTVDVKCASGSALTTTTSATGTWQVTISGQTLPCAVQVSGGQVGGAAQTQPFHSIAVSLGTVNVTPLTDLVVANLTGANPGTWFSAASFTVVNAQAITTALNSVSTALGLSSQLGTINPLTAAFQAQNGDTMDDILEAFRAAITAVASDYAALLAAASSGNFSAFTGFGPAFAVAYVDLTGGTNNGGGSVTCGANETALVYSGTAGQYTTGQTVCFEASTTALNFADKTLSNPVQNTVVQAPASAYKFTDASLTYEVVFINGVLHEINVSGTTFEGQFAAASVNAGSGTSTLTVATTAAGITAPAVVITGVQAPTTTADFCNFAETEGSLTGLTVTGCTYSGNVGTITATLLSNGLTIPYTVKYTYS
jgi:hypothetical protein